MALRIGIIGDTHLDSRRLGPGRWWDRTISGGADWPRILDACAARWGRIDEVWHAGDLAGPRVLDDLRRAFAVPVRAVRGNADRGPWSHALPDLYTADLEGNRVAMLHGGGAPRFIIDRITREIGWNWRAVVFGHTHHALCRWVEGVFFLNPGSPTDTRFAPRRTIALLAVDGKVVEGQLIDLEADLTGHRRPLE